MLTSCPTIGARCGNAVGAAARSGQPGGRGQVGRVQTVSRVLGSRREAGSCAAARCSVVAATAAAKTSMQFIKGNAESCVPDVKLTRARDGSSGTAVFFFESPDVFEAGFAEQAGGDITGLYLVDEEGTLSTVDVSAKFVNGKPKGIEARYTMKSAFEWDRFMRFMERYAEDHGLGFSKSAA